MKKIMLFCILLTGSFFVSTLRAEETPTAPCLMISTCLERIQQINSVSSDRPCREGVNESVSNTDRDYQVVQVQETDVPVAVRNGQRHATNEHVAWWKIILFGVGIAPVEFFISTAMHEASHVVAAAASGAEILSFRPYPHIRDNNFYFGSMSYRGQFTPSENMWISAAPMITDTAVIGLYGGLVMSHNLPRNPYVKMSMWVFAAGHWIDIANHIISSSESADSERMRTVLRTNYGMNDVEAQLFTRGPQAIVLAVGGYFLFEGMRDLIQSNQRPKKEEDRNIWERHALSVAPMGMPGDGTLGLSFSGRF